MATMITIFAAICILLVAWFLGLNEAVGRWVLYNLFPTTYPKRGDQVDIYINGVWNRKATVTACCFDFLAIYDAIRCPIDFRGTFYAIGEDANGNTIVYVDDVRHWHLVRRAELIRKVCKVPNEFGTFVPDDDNKPIKDILSGIKEPEKKSEINVEGMP